MVGPSSQISRILLTSLIALLIFYVCMDIELYFRIQNYPLERTFIGNGQPSGTRTSTVQNGVNHFETSTLWSSLTVSSSNNNAIVFANETTLRYSDVSWFGCSVSPLCDVTVKALLLDHTNHYIFGPGATIFDCLLGISEHHLWITPNMISMFHVFVAILSGRCVASDSLITRRIGVVLFEFRTFLDDLDGHVARARKHIKGERSEIGTSGFYIDGLCDGLGCIALLIGIFIFLRNNPPRRGYVQLQAILPTDTKNDGKSDGVIYKAKVTTKKVARKVGCFAAQLLLSSTLWNRYIALYQDTLERDNVTRMQFVRQNVIFKSTLFFCVAWLWRIMNVHNMIHILLLSIFFDKLWEFLRAVQYIGFVVLICVICITEMHILEVQNFIFNNLAGYYIAPS